MPRIHLGRRDMLVKGGNDGGRRYWVSSLSHEPVAGESLGRGVTLRSGACQRRNSSAADLPAGCIAEKSGCLASGRGTDRTLVYHGGTDAPGTEPARTLPCPRVRRG